jgi:hypothetical protein
MDASKTAQGITTFNEGHTRDGGLAKDPRCISSSLGQPWLMLLALLLLQLHPLYLVPHQIPRFS